MTNGVTKKSSSTEKLNRDVAHRALDDLFSNARQYNSSNAYFELVQFISRFRFYSPFNAMLIHIQMPGARFVATARRWNEEFRRTIRIGARAIVILQPMGPVLFVFDIVDTESRAGAPPLPRSVEHPFEVLRGKIGTQLDFTIGNARRDGVRISERPQGAQLAGSIQAASSGAELDFVQGTTPKLHRIPLRYELLLNSNLSAESRYATLVHELGHLYCGHLGTWDQRSWPDRRGMPLVVREFEAESVSYLVCSRLGIENASAEYLAGYVRKYEETPPISLHCVMQSSWLIEQMGRKRLLVR